MSRGVDFETLSVVELGVPVCYWGGCDVLLRGLDIFRVLW
jgi:hypothetical protein